MKNSKIEWTSVQELIDMLQVEVANGYGDIPVCVKGMTPIALDYGNTWYDGGYVAADVNDRSNLITSKNNINFPKECIHLYRPDPEKLNGRPEREIDLEFWEDWCKRELEERNFFDGELAKYKASPEKNLSTNNFPTIAYLERANISAAGESMNSAKEALKLKYSTLKKLHQDSTSLALFATSENIYEREAATLYAGGFRLGSFWIEK